MTNKTNTVLINDRPERSSIWGFTIPFITFLFFAGYSLIRPNTGATYTLSEYVSAFMLMIMLVHIIRDVSDWYHLHLLNPELLHQAKDPARRKFMFIVLMLMGYMLPIIVLIANYTYATTQGSLSTNEMAAMMSSIGIAFFVLSEATQARDEKVKVSEILYNESCRHCVENSAATAPRFNEPCTDCIQSDGIQPK